MPVSLQIHSLSTSIDMFGEPDPLTAYSLSGHVSLSLSSSLWSSFLDQCRPDKIHLKSLCLTFEGRSEVVGDVIGYHAFRVYEASKELVSPQGIELVHDGPRKKKESTWEFIFNMTIPGWLPASRKFCPSYSGPAGTRYSLHAVATFGSMDEGENSSWCMTLPAYLRSGTRTIKSDPFCITLNRYIQPRDDNLPHPSFACAYPTSTYNISAKLDKTTSDNDSAKFPNEVLSAIEVHLTQPDRVGLEEGKLAIALRIRASNLSKEQSSRLKWLGFSVDVIQTEHYRNFVHPSYSSRFPLPTESEQPPNKPLLQAHPMKAMVDACLVDLPSGEKRYERCFSVLSEDPSHHHYKVSGDGLVFSTLVQPEAETEDSSSSSDEDSTDVQNRTWYKVQANVPIPRHDSEDEDVDEDSRPLRPTEDSPLFSVRHQLRVSLQFSYTLEETDSFSISLTTVTPRQLQFTLPLRFAHIPPASRVSSAASSVTDLSLPLSPYGQTTVPNSSTSVGMLDSRPYVPSLPAYSQLFYPNGDRKIDYSIPLPMYSAEPTTLDDQLPLLMEQPELSPRPDAGFQINPKPYRSHSPSSSNA